MTRTRRTALAALTAAVVTCAGSPALVASAVPGDDGSVPASGLQYLIEEEKLAGDVYELAMAEYADRVFGHIAVSEDTHVEAVRALLVRYEVVTRRLAMRLGSSPSRACSGSTTSLLNGSRRAGPRPSRSGS